LQKKWCDLFYTISNLISISRIIIAIPLSIAIWNYDLFWTLTLIGLGLFTDWLDGFLARRLNQISEWGKILDPLADKIIIGVPGFILFLQGRIEGWFAILVISRDILIFLGGIYARQKLNYVIPSNWLGKITVNVISLVFLFAIFESYEYINYFYILGVVFIVSSFLLYLVQMIKKIKNIKLS
jgi:CDP-diacylglycerol--glycerol-3-phosphate 3-phosphatidyltransferase